MQYQKENDTLEITCTHNTLRAIHLSGYNIHRGEGDKEERDCNFNLMVTSDERLPRGNHVTSVRICNLNRALMEALRNKLNEELERLENEHKVKSIVDKFDKDMRQENPGIVADALKEAGCLTAAKEWDRAEERLKHQRIQEKIREEAIEKLKAAGINNPRISIY